MKSFIDLPPCSMLVNYLNNIPVSFSPVSRHSLLCCPAARGGGGGGGGTCPKFGYPL